MAWTPIQSSGLSFEFEGVGSFASVTLGSDSVVTGSEVGNTEGSWTLTLSSPTAVRITSLSYSDNSVSDPAFFTWQPGSVEVVNANPGPTPTSFLPSVIEVGPAESLTFQFGFTEQAGSFQFLIEVQAQADTSYQEIGRATRNYVSAYQRDRVFRSSIYAAEKRCLVTNFNGAIPPGRAIVSATWQTWDTVQCVMSGPTISGREVQVTVAAQYAGNCRIRVDATLDNGEVYSAWHVIRVQPAPYFNNPGWVTGPSSLTVSV